LAYVSLMTLLTLYYYRFFFSYEWHCIIVDFFFLSFMSTIFSLNYISDDMWTITPFLYVPIYLPNTIVMLSIYVYNTYIFINLYILIILDCVRYPWTKPMFYCGKDFHVRYLYRLRDLSYLYLDQYMRYLWIFFLWQKVSLI
jgi:hypothetical protein